jgi:hypothetical protein
MPPLVIRIPAAQAPVMDFRLYGICSSDGQNRRRGAGEISMPLIWRDPARRFNQSGKK